MCAAGAGICGTVWMRPTEADSGFTAKNWEEADSRVTNWTGFSWSDENILELDNVMVVQHRKYTKDSVPVVYTYSTANTLKTLWQLYSTVNILKTV